MKLQLPILNNLFISIISLSFISTPANAKVINSCIKLASIKSINDSKACKKNAQRGKIIYDKDWAKKGSCLADIKSKNDRFAAVWVQVNKQSGFEVVDTQNNEIVSNFFIDNFLPESPSHKLIDLDFVRDPESETLAFSNNEEYIFGQFEARYEKSSYHNGENISDIIFIKYLVIINLNSGKQHISTFKSTDRSDYRIHRTFFANNDSELVIFQNGNSLDGESTFIKIFDLKTEQFTRVHTMPFNFPFWTTKIVNSGEELFTKNPYKGKEIFSFELNSGASNTVFDLDDFNNGVNSRQIDRFEISERAEKIIVSTYDGRILLQDNVTNKQTEIMNVSSSVLQFNFSQNQEIISITNDNETILYDIKNNEIIKKIPHWMETDGRKKSKTYHSSVIFHPDGKHILITSSGQVRIYNLETEENAISPFHVNTDRNGAIIYNTFLSTDQKFFYTETSGLLRKFNFCAP